MIRILNIHGGGASHPPLADLRGPKGGRAGEHEGLFRGTAPADVLKNFLLLCLHITKATT